MIRFLADSSAVWRILRDDDVRHRWWPAIEEGAVGSCHPQRVEFRRSARDLDDFDEMGEMFRDLFPDVAVPKTIWSWVDSAQYRLVKGGAHRSLSPVDLLICAVAAHRGLAVLHDDNDHVAAARLLDDVSVVRV